MAGISSLGIGSGVLNSDLVDQLVAAERKPTETRLTQKTQRAETMLSAYGKLRSAVTELRLPMRQLSAPDNLKAFSASSSNDDIGVSVDSAKASRGSYSVEVKNLASAQALASQTVFSDKGGSSVGQGSLQLSVGDKVTDITIDASNDTLQGLANAINDADAGVSAGVIDTGNGYQLVMSADETGTANGVSISATEDVGSEGLARFAFDVDAPEANPAMKQTIAASDAVMEINGIEVRRSENTFENVIDGLTFDVKETGTSTITVNQDLGAVSDRVQGFVDKFNALQSTIDGLAGFNAEAEQGSVLTGDATVRGIQNQLRSILTGIVPGMENQSVRSLADVGITTDWESGGLEFDRSVFEEKLNAHPDEVTALFAEQGRASDSQVEFVRSGMDTVPGSYDINVTQAATQGQMTGGSALAAGNFEITGDNNKLSLSVNGDITANLQLTEGTGLSQQDLLNDIQAQLDSNNALNAAGVSVQAGVDQDGKLTFTSSRYGSESSVKLASADDAALFGLEDTTSEEGLDIAGTIDGRTAKGDGQVLYLGSDNGDASGLQVRVLGDQTGSRGTITFVEGVGERTVNLVSNMVGAGGAIESRTSSLNRELEKIEESQVKLEERLTSYRERLVSQFSTADSLISQLNNTRDYVTQQLAALAPQNNKD
ncbi:flagellar filament capping protein FliD [Marinobacter adhaerens]|uniref:Flagellar hook-associated protein 2 n=1 Tax=Marinobacter adhaerens TaxID=1033846 RepID=A0A851HPS1_9GAMM|nr:flagellar filament capping protein FliD [Marinobacter adhaerens]NWN91759.1 flagellar filament capping protein FliD [Marinobacter adhaerens]